MNFTNRSKKYLNYLILVLFAAALAVSFWHSSAWLQLCYGLALFLFGMQCIEEGLRSTAGGALERIMTKSTSTPFKSFLFGVGSAFVLQSSTLVSLLTIAFISAGLVTLSGGIAIIFGTNLGATTGIWLLALAGQSISLSPVAVPMLVFGILIGFFGRHTKAVGRILVGVALIFLGIDAIKSGFGAFGGQVDFASLQSDGLMQILLFAGVGFLLTCVLQSSHATLILTLSALAGGQINLAQAFAIALGSNLGSSATTALMGALGSDRSGQRLALAHLIFNGITALICLLLWLPMTAFVTWLGRLTDMSALMQLALFHTLFNGLGVAVFWRWQDALAYRLTRFLPDKPAATVLPEGSQAVKPRYLDANALLSSDIAMRAVGKEIRHLMRLGVEVLCHAVFVRPGKLYQEAKTPDLPEPPFEPNVQALYEWQIKPLYSEILDFVSKMDIDEADSRQEELTRVHLAAFALLGMVKDGKHLQKNMAHFLADPANPAHHEYMQLRAHLFAALRQLDGGTRQGQPEHLLEAHIEELETMRQNILQRLRDDELDSKQASSVMNDINYVRRIEQGVLEILTGAPDLAA